MKPERETVETVDGRIYWSDDNWETVWRSERVHAVGTIHLIDHFVTGEEADYARFIAVLQTEGGD